jgi:hypothetical protein
MSEDHITHFEDTKNRVASTDKTPRERLADIKNRRERGTTPRAEDVEFLLERIEGLERCSGDSSV